ncbi:MAG: COQ9 family protein [Pseudomonadota bacterium]
MEFSNIIKGDLTLPEETRDDSGLDHHELRDRLIQAIHPHVCFDGWTFAALDNAASDLGVDKGVARLLFTGGARDLIAHASALGDRMMEVEYRARDLHDMRIRDKARMALMIRFQMMQHNREAVKRAIAWLMLPGNQLQALQLTGQSCDRIWRLLGDRSTDWNWYSKRTLLAGVYGSAIIVWTLDESDDLEVTEAFIARRIDNVLAIGGGLAKRSAALKRIGAVRFRTRPAYKMKMR